MAQNKKISDLDLNPSLTGAEEKAIEKGGANFKNTLDQEKAYILADALTKAVYDTNDNGIVDDSELVNGLTVETAVPSGALFTDTTYTDSEIKTKYELNADTNAFTDAEKTNLASQSGTNTGDEDTASIQSKRPLKTVGGTSIEGSGDIPIPDTATWGGVSGTLSDQTDLQGELDAKENTITAGTTGEYYRGDKTFQALDSTAVGLGNVDNTSDANKPVSTATQTALDDKVAIATNPSKTVKGAIKAFDDTATDTLWISIDGTDIP